ncbi:DUF4350 domain-containing protein [Lewinella sp. IMCC34183]|uniref:DUF4350 domain-containing protein n=1 Tax=Lewinella sp. IMCC34183 TaxID=2248762 RepID=UPI000E24E141|nr:DUF4350 domain-containing protein [Lewinella sp. IMCC34183]
MRWPAVIARTAALLPLLLLFGCPSVDWYETYDHTGRQPFDLYALHELLAARPEGLRLLRDSADLSLLDTVAGGTYVFVGHHPYYGEAAVTSLLDFVERGNTAFLAAEDIPEDLAYHLLGDACYYGAFEEDDLNGTPARYPVVALDSLVAYRYPTGDSFHLVNIRYWEPNPVPLRTVSERLLCDPALDIQVLGSLDTFGINFLRLGWGDGNFYFHANPVFFTNWFLMDSTAYRYPQSVLAALNPGPVYWDEYHRRYRNDPTAADSPAARREYTGGRNLLSGNQTLRYIQQRRELALAWYLLLAGVLLYVISRGRRRQRIIPVLPGRENSSRRLIDTISRLVHQKGNHAALAQRELASLRFHLNHRRGIRWREGEAPPADLCDRLGLPEDTVARALAQIRVVARGKPLEEGDLLRFYRAIEPLYRG